MNRKKQSSRLCFDTEELDTILANGDHKSNKAVKLEITEDENSKLLGKVKWMPKSVSRLDGKEVGIVIPEWLYEEKVNEKPKKAKP